MPLSGNRALVLDLLHYARQVPSFPLERICQMGELAVLRRLAPTRISWPALFLKAYGLAAAETPQLRQTLFQWPWPHVYEHPTSVAMLSVHRQYRGEDRLCFGRVLRPESLPLVDLQAQIDTYKNGPVEVMFRRQVWLSRLPTWLRRIGWWSTLHLQGDVRARRLGTFGMSVLAGQGANNRWHPSIHSTNLSYGTLDRYGEMPVTLIYDHRLIDGYLVSGVLRRLEEILRGPIARELVQMRGAAKEGRAAA